ncbi:hypothetical protein FOZ60_006916 [Perkinsus olseni]|uniref:Protein kinase domain-containing protein n=1 Tax=Perkinsus olseni TaxID=32597 RepID=A0A7J6PFI7_PEROL|nr:hypothetical protein FOZ60_006916 [Perkinsus olseni]
MIETGHLHSREQVEHVWEERQAADMARQNPSLRGRCCVLLGTYKTQTQVCLVLTAMRGDPIHHHFQHADGGHFTEFRTKFYIHYIASTLKILHEEGYIYRDLKALRASCAQLVYFSLFVKASNVLLVEGRPVLIDFGMCKNISKTGRTYSVCGTYHAMAPEVRALSGLDHDTRVATTSGYGYPVDFWGLGILLVELLTGKPPFGYRNGDIGDLFELSRGSPSTIHWAAGFQPSRDLRDLVESLLQPDPSKRLADWETTLNHPYFAGITDDMPPPEWHCRSCIIPQDDAILDVIKTEREIEKNLSISHVQDTRRRQVVGVIRSRATDRAVYSAIIDSLSLAAAPECDQPQGGQQISLYYCRHDGSVILGYSAAEEACEATEAVIGAHACIGCQVVVLISSRKSEADLQQELEAYFSDFIPGVDAELPRLLNCPSPSLIIVCQTADPDGISLTSTETIQRLTAPGRFRRVHLITSANVEEITVKTASAVVSTVEAHLKPKEQILPGDEIEFIEAMEHPPITPAQGLQVCRYAAAAVSCHPDDEAWGPRLFVPLLYLAAMAICPAATHTDHESPLLWSNFLLADLALTHGTAAGAELACLCAARLVARSMCQNPSSTASDPRLRASIVMGVKQVAIPCEACGRPRMFHQEQTHGRYVQPVNSPVPDILKNAINKWVPRMTADNAVECGSAFLRRQLAESSGLQAAKQRISSLAGAPICILCGRVDTKQFYYSSELVGSFPSSLVDHGRELIRYMIARPIFACLDCRPFIMDYCRMTVNDSQVRRRPRQESSDSEVAAREERRSPPCPFSTTH